MITLLFILDHHPRFFGLYLITTHVVENFFGKNLSKYKRNNKLDRVMKYFAEGQIDH